MQFRSFMLDSEHEVLDEFDTNHIGVLDFEDFEKFFRLGAEAPEVCAEAALAPSI